MRLHCAFCDRLAPELAMNPPGDPVTIPDPYTETTYAGDAERDYLTAHRACAEEHHKIHNDPAGDYLPGYLWSLYMNGDSDESFGNGHEYLTRHGRALLITDDHGFRTAELYATSDDAEKAAARYYADGLGADESDAFITYERGGVSVSFDGKHLGTCPTYRRAAARVRLEMYRTGYYPSVWVQGEHGPTIRLAEEL